MKSVRKAIHKNNRTINYPHHRNSQRTFKNQHDSLPHLKYVCSNKYKWHDSAKYLHKQFAQIWLSVLSEKNDIYISIKLQILKPKKLIVLPKLKHNTIIDEVLINILQLVFKNSQYILTINPRSYLE